MRHHAKLQELGEQLEEVWRSTQASWELKKQLIRAVLEELIVKRSEEESILKLIAHWKGGDHTEISVKRVRGNRTDPESVTIIQKLRGMIDEEEIARLLNRNGKRTAQGLEWTAKRVKQFGSPQQNAYVSLKQASKELGVSESKLGELIKAGSLEAERACKWAPLAIARETLQSKQTEQTIEASKATQMDLI